MTTGQRYYGNALREHLAQPPQRGDDGIDWHIWAAIALVVLALCARWWL